MKIQYLGTAAGEGFPALFCHCDVCKKALASGGKNLRLRSQALINNNLLIDWNADTLANAHRFGIDLANIESTLITHIHADHFYTADFEARMPLFAHIDSCKKLAIYGSEDLENKFPQNEIDVAEPYGVSLKIVKPFEPFKVGEYTVTALKARHGTKNPYIYIVESEGKALLYAHDTGIFPDETFDYIKQSGIFFNMISLDCTEGIKDIDYDAHMNFERCNYISERLESDGIINADTVKILSHFSHNGGSVLYDDLSKAVKKFGFSVSYDGLTVEF